MVAIRDNKEAGGDAGMSLRHGSLQVNDLFLKSIITSAYGVHELLISGLPAWAEQARYDIRARVTDAQIPDSISRDQRRALMAALLEDRFRLKVHTVTKMLPVYDLVVANGGLKLQANTGPVQTLVMDHIERPAEN